MNRRELLLGGAVMLGGVAIPTTLLGRADIPVAKCILWIVFLGGSSCTKACWEETQFAKGDIASNGFEILDTVTEAGKRTKILARKLVPLTWAIEQERLLVSSEEASELGEIGTGVIKAIWIER